MHHLTFCKIFSIMNSMKSAINLGLETFPLGFKPSQLMQWEVEEFQSIFKNFTINKSSCNHTQNSLNAIQ